MSDNQPQVGTCDRSKHPLPHAKTPSCWSWIALPQPTPAEPRIETVPDEFQQDWADYDRRGIAGGWEKVAFTSGWGRGFKRGEARAGSSIASPPSPPVAEKEAERE